MNEGLNPRTLSIDTTPGLPDDPMTLQELGKLVDRGMRHFMRKRPEMMRPMTFKERTRAEIASRRRKERGQ